MNMETIVRESNLTPWEIAALKDAVNGDNPYTDNPIFYDVKAKEDMINAALPEMQTWQIGEDKRKKKDSNVILTREQEEIAFLKYNYERYLIDYYAKQLETNDSPVLVQVLLKHIRASIEYRNYILEMNLKLIVSMIKHRIGHRGNMDDLFSDGQMFMLDAIKKFDVSQGTKFSTYAFWSILRGWNRLNKKESERLHKEGLSLHISKQGDEMEIGAISRKRLEDRDKDFCIESLIQILDNNMAELSGDEIRVLKARYFVEGKKPTVAMISERLGIKRHMVTKLEKNGLSKIHRVLEFEFLS